MTCTKCMFYNAGEGTDDMCSVCDENGSAFISAKQEMKNENQEEYCFICNERHPYVETPLGTGLNGACAAIAINQSTGDGVHTLMFKVNGKNGSSTDYSFGSVMISGYRTGA